jgi:hypothetical protein
VTYSPESFAELRSHFPNATEHDEGGKRYIHLPSLTFESDGQQKTVTALLCPGEHSGYTTRLFLNRPFPNKVQNWTTHSILGKQWHTPSYNHVPASLPLMGILACHLRGLR